MVSEESRSHTGFTASPLIVGAAEDQGVGFLDQVDEGLRCAAFEVVERDAHFAGASSIAGSAPAATASAMRRVAP
jgi:hypothetical protein